MNKKFKYLFFTLLVFQFLTGIFHAFSLFVDSVPENDSEKQLISLMDDYHMPDGMGFSPTYSSLFLALSACFSLLCFLGGWINMYLFRKQISPLILKGVLGIQIAIFGICFGLMAAFTFLPPVVFTGLIFLSCIAVYFTVPKQGLT